ncbi:type 2 lactosamine alpha-2,3-sialyltransferase isoform X4 [Physeter macrocephalus]|uniref:Type 2 lactosamine alpha-2,3-sialyltransferase isoform X4 n=1 Tax=Physeter macrocephalus TaxID=9755 RepID=A0A9W2WS74_PHYMC|nr:type 2 lactosamine alpha-2,3-sialyltransferase isoform X4 [Physeter catodon]
MLQEPRERQQPAGASGDERAESSGPLAPEPGTPLRSSRRGLGGVPPVEMKKRNKIQPCLSKPAFASLLRFHQFHPFLCAADFKNTASFYGSDKFDLPYGIRTSAEYFRLALSKLQSCDLFDEFDNVPCKKCVVVGNGGVLKNKTLGEKIDSYDVIIRMNNGPILGHEEEVGRRTTFRLFYPESVFSDPNHNDPNTTVILTAFKPLDLKWLWELLTGGKININGFWKKPALNLIYKPYQIRILDPFIIRTAAYELLHFPKVFPKNQVVHRKTLVLLRDDPRTS